MTFVQAGEASAYIHIRIFTLLLLVTCCLLLSLPAQGDEDGGLFRQDQISVILEPGSDIAEVNAAWGTLLLSALPEFDHYLVQVPFSVDLEEFAEQMKTDPVVDDAEPNWIMEGPEAVRQMVVGAVGGNYSDFEDQGLCERIGLDEAHLRGRGAGITIALIDTGVDPEHKVLAGRLSPDGWDFLDDDATPWETANGIDDDDDGFIDEGYGHGTMVAGLLALVAPEAVILPVRILDDEGRSDLFTVARAMQYVLDQDVDIINLSFGIKAQHPATLRRQFERCVEDGIIAVAGAGNEDNENPPYYPAAFDDVLMITALDENDIKADFADFYGGVSVSAPGVGVRSAYPGGGWGLGAGCSFATPLVAGEVALLLGNEPDLTVAEVHERVEEAVEPVYQHAGNAIYIDKLGMGRIYLPLIFGGEMTAAPEDVLDARAGLRVFPNPAAGQVRFSLPGDRGSSAGGSLSIFDVSGRRVTRIENASTATVWNRQDSEGRTLPPGVYFARWTTRDGVSSSSFVLLR